MKLPLPNTPTFCAECAWNIERIKEKNSPKCIVPAIVTGQKQALTLQPVPNKGLCVTNLGCKWYVSMPSMVCPKTHRCKSRNTMTNVCRGSLQELILCQIQNWSESEVDNAYTKGVYKTLHRDIVCNKGVLLVAVLENLL